MRRFLWSLEPVIVSMAMGALALGALAGGCPSMDEAGAAVLDGSGGAASSGSDGALGSPGAPGTAGAQGAQGAPGAMGAAGLNCWDINGNGIADPLEDFNADGVFDALDCQGIFAVGAGLQLSGDLVGLDTSFTDSRYWKLGGNNLAGPFSLGTLDAQPLEFLIGGTRAWRLRPDSSPEFGASPSLVAGWSGNSASPDAVGITIAGGGSEFEYATSPTPQLDPMPNVAFDSFATIGGGRNNFAGSDDADPISSPYATVAGGTSNSASGEGAVVGGGIENIASDLAATVAGGVSNVASEEYAAVGGGVQNVAAGPYATVAGGGGNQANNLYATVAGGGGNAANVAVGTIGGGYLNVLTQNYTTIPGGSAASADVFGQMAYAAGSFAEPGDAQMSFIVMRAITTDATQAEIRPGGSQFLHWSIAPETSVAFDILVAARADNGTHGAFHIIGSAEHEGATVTLVGVTVNTLDPIAGGVAVAADSANGAIKITATGTAGRTIRWVATVRMTEVRFP